MSSSPYSATNVGKFLNDNFGLLIVGAALFVGGFVFGSLWTENKTLSAGGAGAGTAAQQQAAAPQEATPLSDDEWQKAQEGAIFSIGKDDALVTMVEFTDYQCPFCERHFSETHSQIIQEYVDTGKLRILYRDQALPFHPNSNTAAQSVRCAVDQNKPEAMHDALFANQASWIDLTGDALFDQYAALADEAGLNGAELASCVESGQYKQAVDDDGAYGLTIGAGGTPTFFIQGKPVVGAQPFTVFQAEIDAALEG